MTEQTRHKALARGMHAITVGLAAAGAWTLTHNEVAVTTVVIAVSAGMGELIGRVVSPPLRSKRKRSLTPLEAQDISHHLEKLQGAVNGDIHDVLNLLAALKADIDLLIDAWRRRLDEFYEEEGKR